MLLDADLKMRGRYESYHYNVVIRNTHTIYLRLCVWQIFIQIILHRLSAISVNGAACCTVAHLSVRPLTHFVKVHLFTIFL